MSKTQENMYSEVVWAKYGSFPWWPSFIYDPTKLPTTCAQQVKNRTSKSYKKEYTFFYFGDVNYGFAKPSDVKPYNEDTKKVYCKQKIPARYQEGFEKGLQLADMQSALPKSERLSWHYTNAAETAVSASKGSSSTDTESEGEDKLTSKGKRRGRPKKDTTKSLLKQNKDDKVEEDSDSDAKSEEGEESKKRRGRSAKNLKTDGTDDHSAVSETKPKENKEPKRRGRPPKKAKTDISDEHSAVSDIKATSQHVTEVKRRGRPPRNLKTLSGEEKSNSPDLYFQEKVSEQDRNSAEEEDNESRSSSSNSSNNSGSDGVEELQSVSEEEEDGSVASSDRNNKKRKLDSGSSSAEPLRAAKRGRGRPKKTPDLSAATAPSTARSDKKASKEVVNEVEQEEDEEEGNRVVRSRPSTSKPAPPSVSTSVTSSFSEESVLDRLTRFANILRLCSENNEYASIARAVKILDKLAALKETMSEELLRSSGIGKVVSVVLRKHPHADISERASALRTAWMAIVKGEPPQPAATQGTDNTMSVSHNSSATPLVASTAGNSNQPVNTTSATTSAAAASSKPNPFRTRAVRLLRDAIDFSSAGAAAAAGSGKINGEVAFAVEKAAFEGFGASQSHYFEFITRTAQAFKTGQEDSAALLEKLRNGQLHSCMVFASPS